MIKELDFLKYTLVTSYRKIDISLSLYVTSDLPLKYNHLATPPWILKEDNEDDDYDEEIPEQN